MTSSLTLGITDDDGQSVTAFSLPNLPRDLAHALAAALPTSPSADVHLVELVDDDDSPQPVYAPAPDGSPF